MNPQTPNHDIPQLDAMRLGTDYRQSINVRGFTLQVRPLAISESLDVASTVVTELNKLPEAARNQMTEHFLVAKETLKKASTSAPGMTDLQITDHMLMAMTNDEVHFLFKQYVVSCDKVNPALEVMSEADLKALVDELKQKKAINPWTLN